MKKVKGNPQNLIHQAPHKKTAAKAAEVQALGAFGVAHEDIAAYVGISKPTLCKYYRDELDEGAAKGKVAVTKFLFNAASGRALEDGAAYADCLRAAMFYAKTRMGWKENSTLDVTNSDGTLSPMRIEIVAAGAKEAITDGDDTEDA